MPTETPPEPTPAEAPAPAASKAQQAATVANAIAAGTDPEVAMQAEGLTADSFRELLYDVAEDPALTDAYLAARR